MSRAAALLVLLAAGADGGAAAEGGPRAAPRSVLVRTERTEARLGEPLAYEIDVRHAPAESYALAGDLDAPPFRGIARGCRRSEDSGEARTTCALSLSLFALGPHDVPEVRFSVRTAEGDAVLAVPGPRITGVGIIDFAAPPETLALREPAPAVPLLLPSLRPLAWGAAALAAIALALLAARAWRRRARGGMPAAPPEPPGARLRRRLDALEARELPARGLGREHLSELSGIVREWVGAVLGVNALDLTTAELAAVLRRAADPRLDAGAVLRFCEEADLVKFARAPAGAAACAAATAWARTLAADAPPSASPAGAREPGAPGSGPP